MSRTIDDRVVSMEFNNKQFESNVKTSLGTIDKLKQSLNFSGAAKGLESVNAAAKSCNLAPLGGAIDGIKVKFGALEVMAVTALSNITNSAVNAGKRMIAAFTIDPVKTGLAEYETQIGAIQTILANTEKEGATLGDVNRSLNELNAYADKTIYNFTEMTRNIGTFTAAGVKLDTSVNAIKGIANLAAISGSTSQQASTAMYQLSQALASGTVKLMDWNSVVNAGMGGQVFQDALKETARVHGINIDKMIKKHGSFRETLQTGWLTSEILTETLMKFTMTTEGLTDAEIARNREMLRGIGYTEAQIDEIFKLGNTATNAATKVKTFTQLMDTLKEAAQSGWAQTWSLIIGDFEEAKALWTGVSDIFGGMITKSAEARNEFLAGALDSNWDRMLDKINAAGVSTEIFEKRVREIAKAKGIDIEKYIEHYGTLEEVFKSGKLLNGPEILKESLDGLDKSIANLDIIDRKLQFRSKGEDVKEFQKALRDLGYDLGEKGVDGILGKDTQAAIKAFQKANGLKVTGIVDDKTLGKMKELTKCTTDLNYQCDDLIDGVTELGGRELLIQSLKNVFDGLMTVIKPISNAFKQIFKMDPENLYELIEKFEKFTSKLKLNEKQQKNLQKTFKGLFAVVEVVGAVIGKVFGTVFTIVSKAFGKVNGGVLEFTGNIGDALVAFRDWLLEGNKLTEIFDGIVDWVSKAATAVYDFFKNFIELPEVQEAFGKFKNEFVKFKDVLKGRWANSIEQFKAFIGRVKELDSLSFKNIGIAIKDFWDNVVGRFFKTEDGTIFDGFIESIKNIKDKIDEYLTQAGVDIKGFGQKVKNFIDTLKTNISDNLGGLLAIGVLATFFWIVMKIVNVIKLLASPLEFIDSLGDSIERFGKALSKSVKATAMKNVALAIAILAGSLVVLAMLPTKQLKAAVIALVIVAAALMGLMLVMNKISDNIGELAGISGALLGLSGSLLVFAIAAKIVSAIKWEDLGKIGAALVALVLSVVVLSKATTSLDKVKFASFGTMMMGLAASLLIFSVAIGILGNMNIKTAVQGMTAVGVFLLMTRGVMKTTGSMAAQLPKFGTTMVGLGIALLIFSASVSILGRMDDVTLVKGMAAVGAFLLSMIVMMASTRLLAKEMPKFATTMFGLSAGLLAMAYTIKIIGSLDSAAMAKGGIVVTAFLVMMGAMMAATRMLTKNSVNAGKVGLMMLSFAGAMLILSGSMALLSLIKVGDLVKGVVAIGMVGMIFAGMVALTKYAKAGKNVRSTIIGMTIAIGVLAVSLVALSFVDTKKLMGAMGGLVGVMLGFAAVLAATKFLKVGIKEMAMLLGLTGIVAILGGILYLLSDMPVDSVLPIAKALSTLILSLSASCLLLAAVGAIGPVAFIGIGVLAALMAVIGIFAGIAIASLPAIGKKLSEFMNNMGGFLEGASKITPEMGTGIKNLAEAILMLTGANLMNALTSFYTLGFGDLDNFGKQVSKFGDGLSEFIKSINGLSIDGENGSINWDFINNAMEVAKKLVEVAKTMPSTGGIATWGSKKDLGEFGKQIGEFAAGLSSYLYSFGGEMLKMTDASGKVTEVDVDWDAVKSATNAATDLVEVANSIPDTSGLKTVFGGKKDLGAFGTQIANFTKGLNSYLASMGGELLTTKDEAGNIKEVDVNWKNVDKATEAAGKLAEAAGKIPDTSGWGTVFAKKDLGAFGTQIANFAKGLNTYLALVSGEFVTLQTESGATQQVTINWENVTNATDTAVKLAEAAGKIPDTSGWVVENWAKKDLGQFGDQIAAFAEGLGTYLMAVGGKFTKINSAGEVENVNVNWTNVNKATDVASELATIAGSIPNTDPWHEAFNGKNIGIFGGQIATFADGLSTYLTTMGGKFTKLNAMGQVETVNVNWETISKAATTAGELAEIAQKIPNTDTWHDIFNGKNLGDFGTQISTFATGLTTFIETVQTTFSASGENAAAASGTIDTSLIDAAIDVATKLSSIATTVADCSTGWEWLVGESGLSAFGTKVAELGTSLSEFMTSVSGEGFDSMAITKAVAQIKKFVSLSDDLGKDSADKLGEFGKKIKDIGGNIKHFYDKISKVDGSKFSSVATGLEALASIKTDNSATLQSFIDSLGDVGTEGVDKFVSAFKNSTPQVISAVTLMMNAVKIAVAANSIAVKTAFGNVAKSAASTLKSNTYYSKFKEAGKYLVQGFAKGIELNKYISNRAAAAMANEAAITAEKQLDINSPSKVFKRIGSSVPEGFALGISMFANRITDATVAMSDRAVDGTKNALAKVRAVADMDFDSQPTIRPVVDLSNVIASANTINGMFSMKPSVDVMSDVNRISSMMNARQNGVNDDVVSAIKDLGENMSGNTGDTYYVGDVRYEDGSSVGNAIKTLVRAMTVEGRA